MTVAVYLPPNRVTCVPGPATSTTCKILVVTLFSPVTNTVSVVVNNVTYVSGTDFTLTARGTDGGGGKPAQVCWSGVLTATGLSANRRYSWHCSQKVSSVLYSDDGSLMTKPTGEFSLFFGSCDNNAESSDLDGMAPWTIVGSWEFMHAYGTSLSALPVAGLIFVDDYGYVDRSCINDVNGDSPTGLSSTDLTKVASTTLKEYDYCLGWCSILGMLGPTDASVLDGTDPLQQKCRWGREQHRSWCRKNFNLYSQWGDHEFTNDLGFNSSVTSYPNPRFASAGVDGAGKKTWDYFLGLIKPPSIGSLDTTANHWGDTFGSVAVATMDNITNSTTSGTQSYDPPSGITHILGNNQIDDVLSWLNSQGKVFNLLGLQFSLRYPVDTPKSIPSHLIGDAGAQHPLYDHTLGEYQRLFTATGNSPKSIRDNTKLNGLTGCTVCLHGDYHFGHVYRMQKPAYAGNADETIYSICVGTVNGSAQKTFSTGVVGDVHDDVKLEFLQSVTSPYSINNFNSLRVDVTTGPVMTISLMNGVNELSWSGKWFPGEGNSPRLRDANNSVGFGISQ